MEVFPQERTPASQSWSVGPELSWGEDVRKEELVAAREASRERCGEEQHRAVCSWSLAHMHISGQLRWFSQNVCRAGGGGRGGGVRRRESSIAASR